MRYLFFLFLSINLFALTPLEIAQKADQAISGFKDAKANMEMTLINANNQKKVRELRMMVLEQENGNKSLMEFLSPADVQGTRFLSYEHIDKDDDQCVYIPALKRVKRISSRNKSGAFMGSEFSYEDLSAFNAKKYTYSDTATKENLNGKECYKIEYVPVAENSGYTKEISWVDTTTFLVQKTEYYDKKQELLKTATFEKYRIIDGKNRIEKLVMLNHQNDKETILLWKNETINTGLNDNDFHKRVLKR